MQWEVAGYFLLKCYVLLFCDGTSYFFLPKIFCLASCLFSLFSPDIHAIFTPLSLLRVGKVFPVPGTRQRPHAGCCLALLLYLLLARRSFGQMIQLFCTSVPSDEMLMFLQASEDYSDYLESALRNCY